MMDNSQKKRIQEQYRSFTVPHIENIQIADVYEFLDPELIQLLKEKINALIGRISIFDN